jgi:DNA polymerase
VPPGAADPAAVLAAAYAEYQCIPQLAHLRETSAFVPGDGPLSAAFLLIGEGPGEDENTSGRPFTGPAGRRLDELLALAGLSRGYCFTTNVVKYRCTDPHGRNRAPHQFEAEVSLPCLAAEAALIRPLVIVTLGAVALKAACPDLPPVSQCHGRPVKFRRDPPDGETILLPLYHPSACLRDPAADAMTRADIAWLRTLTCG